ncbi:hypothetical protein F7R91_05625 [Streptomyces luteolifulvus]|uniref:Homeodomain-like domain-containing protein n=1 Tax=Streptomyces luteolifulvus TaxID=2615112 RepID=A0A6H9V364_9ACTN|nr:helix-turn-helix domain-containing protein [Streptomyces luteolifulvus]KAB1149238.1 hypothetical protein F7R91_05625 [Streptomyces luteolifulvus]
MARISAEKREEAARLLAEGRSADWIASRLTISSATVRRWRRTDPAFQALEQQYRNALYGRGLLAVAERRLRPPARLRIKPDASPLDVVRDAMTEVGRKEARRGR